MINFQRLIRDLNGSCGWTEQRIADYCGVGQSTISRLKHDKFTQPVWSTGDALIRLHRKEMRKL